MKVCGRMFWKNQIQMKRWVHGLGLMYVLLLLCSFLPWQKTGVPCGETAVSAGAGQMKEASSGAGEEQREETGTPAGEEHTAGASAGEAPKIAITFDDGPNAAWTPLLLDGLKERGVKATFFLIGTNIEKEGNEEIVKRMQQEGHLIGNHTYHHVEITKVNDKTALQEISMTNTLIENITGEPVEYMRPPFGAWQKSLEKQLFVFPVLWTVDPLDWTTENVEEIVNKVVTETKENDIILMHDCYKSSVEAALRIIDILKAKGYEFVTVDELIVD